MKELDSDGWDERLKPPERNSGTLARRPLKSFVRGTGYYFEVLEQSPPRKRGDKPVPLLVAYQEADERTFWRRVDGLDGDVFEIIPERTERRGKEAQRAVQDL